MFVNRTKVPTTKTGFEADNPLHYSALQQLPTTALESIMLVGLTQQMV